jgi:TPR repeat protein
MGMMHWKGWGVPEDKRIAKRLLSQAAEKKVYEAQRLFSLWNYAAKVRQAR